MKGCISFSDSFGICTKYRPVFGSGQIERYTHQSILAYAQLALIILLAARLWLRPWALWRKQTDGMHVRMYVEMRMYLQVKRGTYPDG